MISPSSSNNELKKNKKNKGGKKQRLTKGDIGNPSDFRFVLRILLSRALTQFDGNENFFLIIILFIFFIIVL